MSNIDWESLHFKSMKIVYSSDFDRDLGETFEVVTLWDEESNQIFIIHSGWKEAVSYE